MKFGQSLLEVSNHEWREFYVDYGELKKLLKAVIKKMESGVDAQPAVDAFFTHLDSSVCVVNDFYLSKEKEFVDAMQQFSDLLQQVETRHNVSTEFVKSMVSSHGDLSRILFDLSQYANLNYMALYKIVKKFDKRTKSHRLHAFMAFVNRQPFLERSMNTMSSTFKHLLNAAEVLKPTHAQLKNDIRNSLEHVREAMTILNPLCSIEEAATRNSLLEQVPDAVVAELDSLVSLNSHTDVNLCTLQAKVKLFGSVLRDLGSEIQKYTPEAAAAFDNLQLAHATLFNSASVRHDTMPLTVPAGNNQLLHSFGAAVDSEVNLEQKWTFKKVLWFGWTRFLSYFPFLLWFPAYSWRKDLLSDVVSAFTIGVMGIPQGLAYALLAELPAYYGLYTLMLPAVVYSFLGTSKQLAVGPLSIPALLVGSAIQNALQPTIDACIAGPPVQTENFCEDEILSTRVAYTMLLSFFVGVLYLLMGVLHFGFLVNFISRPVLKGFASGAALITSVSVFKDILGVHVKKTPELYLTVANIVGQITHSQPSTLIAGLCSLAFLLFMKNWKRTAKIPAPLVLVIIVIPVMAIFDLKRFFDPAEMVATVPSQLPSFTVPSFHLPIASLLQDAVFVAFVGFIESISISKTYAMNNRYEIDASQELVALGAANMVGGCFLSFPVMGAFSRTAVNANAGARSQLSLLFSAALAACLTLVAAPLFSLLPKAVLAAIVIGAVIGLVDISGARFLWKVDRFDLCVMAIAFGCTLGLGVQLGVLVAIGVSLALFVYNNTAVRIVELGRLPNTVVYRELKYERVQKVAGIRIVRFSAPLFYANAPFLKESLLRYISHAPTIEVAEEAKTSAIRKLAARAFQAVKTCAGRTKTGIQQCACCRPCVSMCSCVGRSRPSCSPGCCEGGVVTCLSGVKKRVSDCLVPIQSCLPSHAPDAQGGEEAIPKAVILDCSGISHIDSTGVQVLHEITGEYTRKGIALCICAVDVKVLQKMKNADQNATHGLFVFNAIHQAVVDILAMDAPPAEEKSHSIVDLPEKLAKSSRDNSDARRLSVIPQPTKLTKQHRLETDPNNKNSPDRVELAKPAPYNDALDRYVFRGNHLDVVTHSPRPKSAHTATVSDLDMALSASDTRDGPQSAGPGTVVAPFARPSSSNSLAVLSHKGARERPEQATVATTNGHGGGGGGADAVVAAVPAAVLVAHDQSQRGDVVRVGNGDSNGSGGGGGSSYPAFLPSPIMEGVSPADPPSPVPGEGGNDGNNNGNDGKNTNNDASEPPVPNGSLPSAPPAPLPSSDEIESHSATTPTKGQA